MDVAGGNRDLETWNSDSRPEFVVAMDKHCWNYPVSLEMYGRGHYRVVSSPKDAVRVLCEEWPVDGQDRDSALERCLAALRGEADVETSRDAFLSAANAARIPIVN